jgi:hypothetical protein
VLQVGLAVLGLLRGKGGHIRTVPIPQWAKQTLDEWLAAAGITKGRVFRAVARGGKIWGSGISENVVWYVVRRCCQRAGLEHIAPHDLRRTCAKLCHTNGGELEQIQFLLGHASVLTTERYLGCKQNLGHPVNDLFDLKTNLQTEDTPGSATAQAGRRPEYGDGFRRPAPEAVREKGPQTVSADELPASDGRFLVERDGAA